MRRRVVGMALLLGVALGASIAGWRDAHGRNSLRPYRIRADSVGAQFIAPHVIAPHVIAPHFIAPHVPARQPSPPASADAPSATSEQLAGLQSILARPEFQVQQRRGILDWLLDPIRSWLRWLGEEIWAWISWIFEPAAELGSPVILYAIVGVAVVVLIVVALTLRRLMRGTMAGEDALTEANAAGPPRAADELARARALAQAGDPRRAIHHLYRAVLLRLDERDHLPFDGTLTNRELLPRVSSEPALAGPFAELVARFDRLWYGQAACSAEEYAAFAQLGERVWQAAGTVAPAHAGRGGAVSPGVPLGASSGAR